MAWHHGNDELPRYWILSQAGPMSLAHPSPLSPSTPPRLVQGGLRPVRVQCVKDRRWIDVPIGGLMAAVAKAKNKPTGKPETIMVPR
jgi:hypothetical protein